MQGTRAIAIAAVLSECGFHLFSVTVWLSFSYFRQPVSLEPWCRIQTRRRMVPCGASADVIIYRRRPGPVRDVIPQEVDMKEVKPHWFQSVIIVRFKRLCYTNNSRNELYRYLKCILHIFRVQKLKRTLSLLLKKC